MDRKIIPFMQNDEIKMDIYSFLMIMWLGRYTHNKNPPYLLTGKMQLKFDEWPWHREKSYKKLWVCSSHDNDNELCKNVSWFFMIYHARALPCHHNKATTQGKNVSCFLKISKCICFEFIILGYNNF